MDILLKQLKEVSLSVLPITALVIILNFTIVPIESEMLIRFIIGAFLVIIGLGIFLFGAQIGIGPIGHLMGETIAKTNKAYWVGILGFMLGFLVTIAEPDLQILANQVNLASGGIVPSSLILIVVSIGVGIIVGVGLLRILFGKPLELIAMSAKPVISMVSRDGKITLSRISAVQCGFSGCGEIKTPKFTPKSQKGLKKAC